MFDVIKNALFLAKKEYYFIKTKLFETENDLFYIGGNESLPPPLSQEEEAELLERPWH